MRQFGMLGAVAIALSLVVSVPAFAADKMGDMKMNPCNPCATGSHKVKAGKKHHGKKHHAKKAHAKKAEAKNPCNPCAAGKM